jgi:hypothetical protein
VEFSDFRVGIFDRWSVIKLLAIVKMKAIPWIQRPKFKIIFTRLAEQFEQFIKQKRGSDDRWSSVMAKATTLKHLCAPANRLQPVDKCDRITPRTHSQGGSYPTETGADNQNITLQSMIVVRYVDSMT